MGGIFSYLDWTLVRAFVAHELALGKVNKSIRVIKGETSLLGMRKVKKLQFKINRSHSYSREISTGIWDG